MDGVRRVLGHEAFRCRKCRHRFYASNSATPDSVPQPSKSRSSKRRRHRDPGFRARLWRRMVWITVFTVAFFVFLYFLRFIISERAAPDELPVSSVQSQSIHFSA